jgi:hypothetical protein
MVKVQRRSATFVSNSVLFQVVKALQDLPEKPRIERNGSSLSKASDPDLKSALESFKQGWKEVRSGQTKLLSDIWDDIDP